MMLTAIVGDVSIVFIYNIHRLVSIWEPKAYFTAFYMCSIGAADILSDKLIY